MRDLSELNINEGGRPVSRAAPSKEVFDSFELKTGLKIPVEYQELLRFSNGGHPELDSVNGPGGQFSVNSFYHLTANIEGSESLWSIVEHWRPSLGSAALPFANDGGGNQFFLDLSTQPSRVRLCVHDEGMRIIEISKSFSDFINSLELDPEMI